VILKVVSACEQIIVIHDGMERVVYLVGASEKIMEGESEDVMELSASTEKELHWTNSDRK
jgi:hypothetical protein